ncbi:hypothetical protein DL93DRAFT_2053897 [Clavulina sp. PMI_390]|nr:hypothetical protein DL93DRAFT_2053897 [Clavulina sp. PMI_390]
MSFTNSSHPSANGTDIANAKNNASNVPGVDHRIFIESKQKYVKVRITAQTRAADVLARVSSMPGGLLRGPNSDERAIGGWMLYEVAVDFGMERPVREYELVVDVLGTWPAGAAGVGAQVNYLIIKRSGLRGALSMKHLPKSSPIHEGTVQHESKKGKWSKRSLKLREHSLFIAKKDVCRFPGKDEVHLCSLSNFDGYYVTKPHRAPKNFVFAVRSTDNLNMFENPSDSVHIFSCEAAEGERWLEKILLARSYVLRQERTILFESPSSPAAPKPPHLNPFAIPPHQPTPSPVALQRKPSLGNVPSSSGMHVSRSQTQRRAAPPSRPSTSDGRPSYSGSHPNVAITAGRPSLGSRPSPGSGAGMTPASPARRMKPAGGPLITLDSTQWAEGSLLANWESKGGNPG